MKLRHLLVILYGFGLLYGIADLAYAYPRLPDLMASHFNGIGEPDGWMHKGTFLAVALVGYIVLTGFTVGMALLLPRLPEGWLRFMVSLPRRDYWLAPERRAGTLEKICHFMLIVGCATLGLFVLTLHLAFRANLTTPPQMASWFLYVAEVYMVLMLWAAARLVWHFSRAE